MRLLGSGLWDVPDIGGEPALVGGWFASSPPEARQRFRAAAFRRPTATRRRGWPRSATTRRRSPRCWRESGGGEPFSQQAILNPSGFTGVDGLFRFTPNGLVQRGLAVLEVEPQGPSWSARRRRASRTSATEARKRSQRSAARPAPSMTASQSSTSRSTGATMTCWTPISR